jgi:hypothetical protein
MDGWMDIRMDGRTNGWMDGWIPQIIVDLATLIVCDYQHNK